MLQLEPDKESVGREDEAVQERTGSLQMCVIHI